MNRQARIKQACQNIVDANHPIYNDSVLIQELRDALTRLDQDSEPDFRPILAAILLRRNEPLSPHHVGAIRSRLNYPSDEELVQIIRTGEIKNEPTQNN